MGINELLQILLPLFLILFFCMFSVFVTALLLLHPEVPLTDAGAPLLEIADSIDSWLSLLRRGVRLLRPLPRVARRKVVADTLRVSDAG